MVRANTQPHKDWLAASNRRHQMRLAWADFFKEWDVLLCPNAASAAFPHSMPGERWERMITVNGKPQPATTQMWWAGIAGMCYLPGTAGTDRAVARRTAIERADRRPAIRRPSRRSGSRN
jgi:amidase